MGADTRLWASLSQVMLGFIGYVPKLIFLILLGIIAFYVLRFTQFLFQEVEDGEVAIPGFDPEWATPTARIVQIAAIAFFAVIAFPYLPGAGSEAFRGISIFIGILLSIGSSSAISNIIAGILLTYTRAFRLGDDIEVDGVMGTVIEKGFLVTRLRNYDNQFVSIPNSTVLSNKVVNFRTVAAPRDDLQPPPLLRVTLAIPHEVSPEMAQAVLLRAAWALPEVLREPAPFVLIDEITENHTIYSLKVFTYSPTIFLSSALRQTVQAEIEAAGISLEAPQYFAYYGDGASAQRVPAPFDQRVPPSGPGRTG